VILVLLALGYLGAVAVRHFTPKPAPLLRCALHVHTTASDGEMSDEDMIAAYAIRGYNVVAITDHNRVYAGAEGVREVCGRKVLVLRGMEHSEQVPGTRKPIHVVIIHGVRILAHPRHSGLTREEFQSVPAAYYEEWNTGCGTFGPPITTQCPYSYGYEGLGKLPVAVDDAHRLNVVGFAATAVPAELTVESVVKALRAGKAEIGQ
jgi:hypothetical protein